MPETSRPTISPGKRPNKPIIRPQVKREKPGEPPPLARLALAPRVDKPKKAG
jgi:hypothetical protein